MVEAIEFYERNVSKTHPVEGADAHEYSVDIKDIAVCDEDGNPCHVFDFGQRMRIRIKFIATKPLNDPNFIVAFVRSDNVSCCNFNTAMDDFHIPTVCGENTIELITPNLKLVAELYTIVILVRDGSFQNLHCYQIGTTFHVRDDVLNTHFGVFHEQGAWTWNEDGLPLTE